jgi:TonB-dependent starch-binding outer membrane protein SusC
MKRNSLGPPVVPLLLGLLLWAAPPLAAQEGGTITGRVVDAATQAPISGAQVRVQGTARGATTGGEGRFEISGVPAGAATLQASTLGYATALRPVTVTAGQTVDVTFALSTQVLQLDAMVVTGTAGRQEVRAQGATVAAIPMGDVMEVAPVSTVSEVLQGRVPGVSLTQGSGVTGTAQQIRIRGASSISLSNEPLIYVDGIRVDSRQITVASGAVTSALNDINPEDIESIEIVKGPAAATLYGADASAGVIQIITKKGRPTGDFTHRVSAEYGRLQAAFDPPANFAACRAQDVNVAGSLCEGLAVGTIVSDNPLERYGLPNDGEVRSLSWAGRGGGGGYGIYASAGLDEEAGLFPNSDYRRLTGRLNYTLTPSSRLTFGFNFPVTRTDADFPVTAGSSRGWTVGALAGSPLTVGTTTDGWNASNRTPTAIGAIENSYTSLWLTPDVSLEYRPRPGFTNRVNAGIDVTRTRSHEFFPRNDLGWYSAQENRGQITETRRSLDRLTFKYLGVLDVPIAGDWFSTLSAGTEILAEQEDRTYASGIGLTTNAARSVTAAAQISGGQQSFEDRRVGIFGQWEPNFREQLYFQFGLRGDRFAAFGADAGWFLSPSARVSYVVSDAPYWSLPASGISSLRVRAAYGTTGRAPTAGAALRTYSAAPFVTGANTVGAGVIPLNPGNDALRAERGSEFETGVDAGLLDGRVSLEVTYYNKVTRDLLLRVPQAPSLGFVEDPFDNIGEVLNRGLEVAATAKVLQRENVEWEVRAAANTLHNEVTDLGGVAPFASVRFNVNRVAEGQQVGAYYTQRILRVDEAAGRVIVGDSAEFVGNLLPTFEGNAASTLTLGGSLRLYTHLEWKRDFSLYNATAMYRERNNAIAENWVRRNEVLSADERLRRFGPFFTEDGTSVAATSVLEEYIEPADFVRLNEVSLSYRLPSRVRFGASSASLSLAGRNLAVWSDYSGFNPDVQNEFDAIAGRADFYTLPPARRWVLSLDLEF